MPIGLVPYDPRWPRAFESECTRIMPVLQPWLDGKIEHVGSTSVPGLSAKPIVDMLAPVKDHARAVAAIPVLEEIGYVHWATDPFRDWRHWLLTPDATHRTHHLYLMQRDAPEYEAVIAFRDHLRRTPREAERYAAVKHALARRHVHDREAYTRGKTRFIESVFKAMGRRLPHPR